jgi:hypothetical protein
MSSHNYIKNDIYTVEPLKTDYGWHKRNRPVFRGFGRFRKYMFPFHILIPEIISIKTFFRLIIHM